jgi:Resolvase, N terminal domain
VWETLINQGLEIAVLLLQKGHPFRISISGINGASTMTKTVALYLRVSTDDQSLDNQRRDLTAAAERHGWTVVAEFADNGIQRQQGSRSTSEL